VVRRPLRTAPLQAAGGCRACEKINTSAIVFQFSIMCRRYVSPSRPRLGSDAVAYAGRAASFSSLE